MAEFSILSDIGEALVRLLREELCPDPVQSPEAIQLASPAERSGDYHLGVFLYDLREMGECRRSERLRADNRMMVPARPLELQYLLFLNGKAQLAAGAQAEHRVLGRALQALADRAAVPLPEARAFPPEDDPAVTLPALGFEDKSRIWSALGVPYQLAVYCTVSPVMLSSRRAEPFTRVRSVEITAGQGRGAR